MTGWSTPKVDGNHDSTASYSLQKLSIIVLILAPIVRDREPLRCTMQNGGENTKKVIIIGDGFVGKTCFVAKVTEGEFINNYHCTIGGEYNWR